MRNDLRKNELKAALTNCKQGEDSMNLYYSRLKKIWDELDNYIQLIHLPKFHPSS